MSETRTCTQCNKAFMVTDEDLAFYHDVSPTIGGERFDIPPPSLCPQCRVQRRFTFRNFFHLYRHTCDLSGKKVLSMYREEAPFPVYDMHEWWSDQWDDLATGSTVDFARPFFDQLNDLHKAAPRMNIFNSQCENTDYSNLSFQSRNCYLVFGNVGNEDCCYGHIVWQSKDCYDCLYTYRSERCYECIDCVSCYDVAFSRSCENCSNAHFLVHCNGCKNCFGCVGLKNKEYCIFNEQLRKEEYETKIAEFNSGSHAQTLAAQKKIRELMGKEIVKHYHGIQCEDVSGDYLYNCKNVHDSFDAKNCEDSRYLATCESFLHCYDCNYSPAKTEWSLECIAVDGHGLIACHNCLNHCTNLLYCDHCFACKDCFGCVGLKSKQYCILNKQYTKEEYEKTVACIIKQMQKEGTWGAFFPSSLSPFGYNETMASAYFPLSKDEAQEAGYAWYDDEDHETYTGPKAELPDETADATEEVCTKVLTCAVSGKPYRIIPKELQFCKEMRVPLPRSYWMERHNARMALRNPRKLWDRECAKCRKAIQTTYAPERPETVYCEGCYLAEVY